MHAVILCVVWERIVALKFPLIDVAQIYIIVHDNIEYHSTVVMAFEIFR